jgi:hypothetical protein
MEEKDCGKQQKRPVLAFFTVVAIRQIFPPYYRTNIIPFPNIKKLKNLAPCIMC